MVYRVKHEIKSEKIEKSYGLISSIWYNSFIDKHTRYSMHNVYMIQYMYNDILSIYVNNVIFLCKYIVNPGN